MAREVVNEGSACTFRVKVYDDDQLAIAPDSVRYRLTDVTNDRTVTDWTVISPALDIEIVIPSSSNRIYEDSVTYQEMLLSIQANYDTSAQYTQEHRYLVRNLSGFE